MVNQRWLEFKKSAHELWDELIRWVLALFGIGSVIATPVLLYTRVGFQPVVYVGLFIGSFVVGWIYMFVKKEYPKELKEGDD